VFYTRTIDGVAGSEVVGAVEDHVNLTDQLRKVFQAFVKRNDRNVGIHCV
jgi:hypothetical protein